jgi:hypothetical protein
MRDNGHYYDYVLFEVDTIWKGLNETQVILRNESQYDNVQSSVDQHFTVGESYLVYAYNRDTYLQTNPCKGTKFLSDANKDLSVLGEGEKPTNKVDLETSLKTETALIGYENQTFVLLLISLLILVVLTLVLKKKKDKSDK